MTERLMLLDEKIVEKLGTFERVIRWYEGWHPELKGAVLVMGQTGKETRLEQTIIRPNYIFRVNGRK